MSLINAKEMSFSNVLYHYRNILRFSQRVFHQSKTWWSSILDL